MAKIILKAGKVAVKIILPFVVLGVIFCSIKMLTPAKAQTEPGQSALTNELALAETFQGQGLYAEAEQIYQSIIERHPLTDYHFEAQTELVILYINWDRPADADAALQELKSSFYEHPDIARAVCDIADLYYWELEKYEKARELHQHVLDNWPDSKVAILSQADIAACNIRLGDAPNAEAAIEKLLAEFSESELIAEAARNIVDEYLSLQQYEKARELCQYVLENWHSSEDAVWLQAGLAISHSGLGDDPCAQVAIDSLLTDFNDHLDLPEVLYAIAEKYSVKGHEAKSQGLGPEAKEYFQKAVDLSERVNLEFPNCVIPRNFLLLANSYEKLVDLGAVTKVEANSKIEHACRMITENFPDSKYVQPAALKLGQINFEKGQWLKATQYWELSLGKYTDKKYRPHHILYPLGRAYEELGQVEKAGQTYNEFIQTTYPGDPRTDRVSARLENLDLSTNN